MEVKMDFFTYCSPGCPCLVALSQFILLCVITCGYYDVMNFVNMFKIPGCYTLGYNDEVCAPYLHVRGL